MRALTVAKYLIAKSVIKYSPISNLKLQKLLYYSQGWYLAGYEKPLFDDRIEAWVHGPVVPEVFRHYRENRWSPIIEHKTPELPREVANFLDVVLAAYSRFSAVQLEDLSHGEEPWLATRGSLPSHRASKAEISHSLMRSFFSRKLHA